MYDVEKYFITEILTKLKYMIGGCEFAFLDILRFSKEIGKEAFVLGISIHSDAYKYVALTNLLLPNSMKKNGVSIEIITILANLCKEKGYDFFITQIANENWAQKLRKHGCNVDEDGDLIVDIDRWMCTHSIRKLRFEEFEGNMILDSCMHSFSLKKKKCIDESMRIFNSWEAEIDVIEDKEYIEAITAIKDDESYFVEFSYNGIMRIIDLISKKKFEEYLKTNKYIGTIWG